MEPLWNVMLQDERKLLVALGGKFYTQKDLAARLGAPPGTIASLRRREGIPMPKVKIPEQGPEFEKMEDLFATYRSRIEPDEPKVPAET